MSREPVHFLRTLVAGLGLLFLAGVSVAAAPTAMDLAKDAAAHGRFAQAAARAAEAADAFAARGAAERALEAQLLESGALDSIGHYREAEDILNRVRESPILRNSPLHRATYLLGLGSHLIATGDAPAAARELEQARVLVQGREEGRLEAALVLNLGAAYANSGDFSRAQTAHLEAAELARQSGASDIEFRCLANAARAALHNIQAATLEKADRAPSAGGTSEVIALVDRARLTGNASPADHAKAFLLLHLAKTLEGVMDLEKEMRPGLLLAAHGILHEAHEIAISIGDSRSEAYANGYLALLYAREGRASEALELTERARLAAQRGEVAGESARWSAQAGRLLSTLGRRDEALDAYMIAIEELQRNRHTIAVGYANPSGSFRDRLGYVYFEAVDLILKRSSAAAEPEAEQVDLRRALDTLELLRAAELRDYYRDECVDAALARRVDVREIESSAAVLYPIVLSDRIEVLVSTRAGIWRSSVSVSAAEVRGEVVRLRRSLRSRASRGYRAPARRLYDWLIAPILPRLEELAVDTLVFVPDAAFRAVPPAALYDGEQFLVERFALASTPGLRLTEPRGVDPQSMNMLRAGLSRPVQGYAALPSVPQELEAIGGLYEGDTLLDAAFLESELLRRLDTGPYNVLHVASHAEFSGDPRETFILTHDGRLTIDEIANSVGTLERRERPLELVTLSACQSAEGDDDAALGLSGLAVKAGARSALGTLWKVNDVAASRLMRTFYAELKGKGVSRAEALRRAQRSMIESPTFRHPIDWAPFLLIGSWL